MRPIDLVILAEDLGTKLLDCKWTPKVIGAVALVAFGFLLGVECVRAVIE